MNNYIMVGIVLGVTFIVGGAVFYGFPKLKEKKIDVSPLMEKAEIVLDGANSVIQVADKILPGNSTVNILKVVEQYAIKGVRAAEQLYLTSKLEKEQRKDKSKEVIYAALTTLGIERTAEIDKIIDGTIEAEVLALGHKDDTAKAIQSNLEQRNQALVEQNTQLQANYLQVYQVNQELQNKLIVVQNTISQAVQQ